VWAGGLAFRSYGVRIGVRVNDLQVLDQIVDRLPPGWAYSASDVVDHLYSVIVGKPSRPTSNVRYFHLLYLNSSRILRTTDLSEVFGSLKMHIPGMIALGSQRKLFVRAGAVAWNGRAVLLPGRSPLGTTTLVQAFVRSGATYYSDQYAVLDRHGNLHPYPVSKVIPPPTTSSSPTAKILTEAAGRARRAPLKVGLIVFTQYEARAHWKPRVLTHGQTLLRLLANTPSSWMRPFDALEVLHPVVTGAITLQSKRPEAESVIESLFKHLEASGPTRKEQ
jgi:hypothetical protein